MENNKKRRKVIGVKKATKNILLTAIIIMSMVLSGCSLSNSENFVDDNIKISAENVCMDEEGFIYYKNSDGSLMPVGHESEIGKFQIPPYLSYMDVVYSIDEISNIKSSLEKFDIQSQLDDYALSRKEENLEKMNLYFSKLALTTLKAQILDAKHISVDNIQTITLSFDELGKRSEFLATIEYKPETTIISGIEVTKKTGKVEKVRVGGIAADVLNDVVASQCLQIDSLRTIDEAYANVISFICASAKYDNGILVFSEDLVKHAEVCYSK